MPYGAMILAIAVVLWTSVAQADDSDKVDSAVQFLRMACVTGEKLEIEGSTDGGFALFKKGLSGEFRFSNTEVSGFVDTVIELESLKITPDGALMAALAYTNLTTDPFEITLDYPPKAKAFAVDTLAMNTLWRRVRGWNEGIAVLTAI